MQLSTVHIRRTPDLSTPVTWTYAIFAHPSQDPGTRFRLLQAHMATLVGEKKWIYTFFCEVMPSPWSPIQHPF